MQSDCLIFNPPEEKYKRTIRWDVFDEELQDCAMSFFNRYSQSKGPFYAFKLCKVEKQNDGSCLIDGVRFSGKAMRFLEDSTEVAVYAVSCGALDDTVYTDSMDSFFSETLKREACEQAFDECRKKVSSLMDCNVCSMNPGSGNADLWPITQLRGLFEILGDNMPVKLSDSGLMVPIKSIAGVFFKSQSKFKSCMFCERITCPDRQLD